MELVTLTPGEFDDFAKYHPLNNYQQSSKYARLMTNHGYDYDLIGLRADNGQLVAASVILKRKITGNTRYGYAPKGFLMNYYDYDTMLFFLKEIKQYYKKQNFIFIKFNPEIITGYANKQSNYSMSYNGNVRIIDTLKSLKVKRRLEVREFDLMEPKYNAFINLKTTNLYTLKRNYRKKIKRCLGNGLSLVLGTYKDIDTLYPLLRGNTNKTIEFYRDFYNVFSQDNSIDLVFVKVDFNKYLQFVKDKYERELEWNDIWNDKIRLDPKKSNLNGKMNSDQKLQGYKADVIKATEGLKEHRETIIAGALIVKQFNRVSVAISGFDNKYKYLNPNHFLYFSIIERYKQYFDFCDIGGVTSKFNDDTSKYNGLNNFKKDWYPNIYEYVGEFDLVCSEFAFDRLIKTSFIENEFNNHPNEAVPPELIQSSKN